jgi:hypothetical protein
MGPFAVAAATSAALDSWIALVPNWQPAGYCLCAYAEGQFRFLLTLPWQ